MKERKTKTFIIKGKDYRFNQEMFNEAYLFQLGQIRKEQKKLMRQPMTEQSFREDMASKICVSADTIKKWRYGINSPGSVEIIADIEKYLQVEQGSFLVEEKSKEITDKLKESKAMTTRIIPDFERNSVRTIYRQLVKLITAFINTNGKQLFTDIPYNPKNANYDCIWLENEKMYSYDEYMETENRTYYVFRENMIDIPEKIYNELYEVYQTITGGYDDRYMYIDDYDGDSWYPLYLEEYCEDHYSDIDVHGNIYVESHCIYELTNGWYQEIREILKDYIPA